MHCSAASLFRHTTNLRVGLSAAAPKRCLQQTKRFCSASKNLPAPDVQKLAQLAHISVTDQQVKDWEPKLQSILQWFSQLQQADVTGVEPAVRADINADSTLRDDIPEECDSRVELMAEVPDRENAYVKVPKIM